MLEAAVMCLAMNLYHEARGEGVRAMMAVAEVTMNRVEDNRYPNNVCDVVKQGYEEGRRDCQFSWYCDGKSDKMHEEKQAYLAYEIAIDYLTGLETNLTKGATHYHANWVNPYWAETLDKTVTIGTHKFYVWN